MLNLWVEPNLNLKQHLHSQKHFMGPTKLEHVVNTSNGKLCPKNSSHNDKLFMCYLKFMSQDVITKLQAQPSLIFSTNKTKNIGATPNNTKWE
jgi:hypothetical protein